MALRLFIGCMLDPRLRESVHEGSKVALGELVADRDPHNPVRLVPRDSLHLTLHFLGETAEERLAGLSAALRENLHGLRAPRLTLDRTDAFPDRRHARVLWAGVRELEPGGLEGVRARVVEAARGAGFGTEKEGRSEFRPHLTLARIRRGPGGPRTLVPDVFFGLSFEGIWVADEVSIVESIFPTRGSGAPRYVPLERIPIGHA